MVTIETADNVLKSFYLDAVTDSLNMKVNPFLAKIERTSVDVVGKDVKKVIRVGMNAGISAGSEDGDLPTSKGSTYRTLTASLKNLYGTISISDKALRASANNEGAFVNLLNAEMDALVKSATFNFSRMLFGDGQGILSTIQSVGSDGKVEVDKVSNFIVGMYVKLSSNEKTWLRVVDVDRNANTIVLYKGDTMTPLNDTEASPNDDILIGPTCEGNEITGLGSIFKKGGEIYGLDRTINGLEPYMEENVGEISEEIIQKAIDKVEEKSGENVDFIICSWGVRRALMKYYQERNAILPTMEIEGGFTALNFNGIPIVTERFCPNGTMYLLNSKSFKLHQLCDWEWMEDGGKILKQVAGRAVYTATLVKYAELMCEKPQAQAMLSGITEA